MAEHIFIPIISAITYVGIGILMFYIWPPIQILINDAGKLVLMSGYGGTFVYGLLERALIPFGLHHVFYMPFWQTAVGGRELVNGQLIEGAQNIFFAELASPDTSHFSVAATRFMSGKFPLMMFGLPGAALAMYTCARPGNKKAVGSLLLSAAISSAVTGITEPLEFAFLFVAPPLYVIHCAFAGLSYMLMHMLNVGIGMTFSGGFLDFFLFGILQGNTKTSWLHVIPVGILYFIVYFIVFRVMILKFNYQTPGHEKDNAAPVNNADNKSQQILDGLGGLENISDLSLPAATRRRVTFKHRPSKLNKEKLLSTGAAAVVANGDGVQVVYGPEVTRHPCPSAGLYRSDHSCFIIDSGYFRRSSNNFSKKSQILPFPQRQKILLTIYQLPTPSLILSILHATALSFRSKKSMTVFSPKVISAKD